jgi:F420-non-reducing hydrogenase iron-sulfur subunit
MKSNTQLDFKPKILGFLCNWCSYAGADLAGVSRIQYPPNIKIIRVMCSGRVDPVFVVEALSKGIDGVIVTGCHIGDCHYQDGNHQTERRFRALTEALQYTRIEPERIRLEWISASEGIRFGEIVRDFTDQIKKLGPNKIKTDAKKDEGLLDELQAVKCLFDMHSTRTLIGKEGELVEEGNVYNDKLDFAEYENIICQNIQNEYIRNYILISAKSKPKSVEELSKKLNIKQQKTLNQISVLMRKNMLAIDKLDGTTPMFISIAPEVDV